MYKGHHKKLIFASRLKMKMMSGKLLLDKLRLAMLFIRLHIRVTVRERTRTQMTWKLLSVNSGDIG